MLKSQAIRSNLRLLSGNLLVVTLNRGLGMFSRQMVYPYASLYILALGGQAEQIGFINSLTPLAGLLMFPLGGYLADRTNRVRLVAIGAYFTAFCYLVYAAAPTWQWVAVAGFLLGFRVFEFPPQSSLIADSLSTQDRAKGIAVMNTATSALAIFSPYVAGWVVDTYGEASGVRALWVVLMVTCFITATISARYLKEVPGRVMEDVKPADLPRVIRDAYASIPDTLRRFPTSLRAMAGIILLGYFGNSLAGPFWVVYASQEIGLSATEWGLILLLSTLARTVFYTPAGALVDKHGRSRFIIIGLIISLVAIPLFVFSTNFWQVLTLRLAIAVTNAFFSPACWALTADIVPREIRGRVMACIGRGQVFYGSTGGGSSGPGMGYLLTVPVMIASLAGGFLYSANPRLPWMVSLVTTGMAVVLSVFYLRDPEQAEE